MACGACDPSGGDDVVRPGPAGHGPVDRADGYYMNMGQNSPVMVAYGAGTNSTAMLVGMQERGERPDLIIFADTGGELPKTYAYLPVMDEWLAAVGFPPIVTVRRAHNDEETLEANCLRHGTVPSVAYGYPTCSVEWKRRPQERYVRAWQPAIDAWARGDHVVKHLGFDASESYRKARVPDDKRYRHAFRLIEWDWDRNDCVEAIARAGLPPCPGSSCFFCPNRDPASVVRLSQREPAHFARALAMEEGMRARDALNGVRSKIVGLARDHTWADIVESDGRQGRMFGEMPCGCFDGDDD